MALLWPSCLRMAPDLEAARKAFFVHAVNDRAWLEHINEIGWKKAWEELKP